MSFQAYWSSAPLLARIAAVLAVLGALVGLGTAMGVTPASPPARTMFAVVHLAVMACFLVFWLRMIYFAVLHIRSAMRLRPSWDPLAPRAAAQIPWMRIAVVAASVGHFIVAVSTGNRDSLDGWSAPYVHSFAAGWTMLGAVIAVAAGPVEAAIAAKRRILSEAAAELGPSSARRRGDAT